MQGTMQAVASNCMVQLAGWRERTPREPPRAKRRSLFQQVSVIASRFADYAWYSSTVVYRTPYLSSHNVFGAITL